MPRAQFRDTVNFRFSNGGLGVPPATSSPRATLYDVGTSNPISDTIYADSTSAITLSNPVTVSVDGVVNFWLGSERELDVVTSATGYSSVRTTVTTDSASALSQTDADARYLKLTGGTLSGTLLWQSDNFANIGANGANRPGRLYVWDGVFMRGGNNQFIRAAASGIGIQLAGGDQGTMYTGANGSGGPITLFYQRIAFTATSFPDYSSSPDVFLERDGVANTLAQRNGTSNQTLNIYGTYTDASNYARLSFKALSGGIQQIWAEGLGTGATQSLSVFAATINFATGGTTKWQIAAAGHLTAGTDNSWDIGAGGASRPRNVYVAGAVANRTKAGTPVDGDFAGPVDGMLVVDTTANKIWARCGGTWKGVTIA